MAERLFPVFEFQSMEEKEDNSKVYVDEYFWPGPLFDFEAGDFARNGANQVISVDGYDEYTIWAMKCMRTQLGACTSYPDFGIDLNGSLDEESHDAVEAALTKTIIEGLKRNPRTERVHSFNFTFKGDSIDLFFIVEPKNLPAFEMNMSIVQ